LAQKYLGSLKKPVDLEESFGSMRLNGSRGGCGGGAGRSKDQQYNIITHKAVGCSSTGAAIGKLLNSVDSVLEL